MNHFAAINLSNELVIGIKYQAYITPDRNHHLTSVLEK